MDQLNILKIKASFAEEVFKNPQILQVNEIAKEALLIYDICLQCLQCCRSCQVTGCCIDLGQSTSDQVIKLCFTLDNTKKILIKLIPLRNEGVIVLNCLKKFERDDMFTIRIREQRINERLDDFIQRVCFQICNELIPKLLGHTQLQEFGNVGLRQQQWTGDMYGSQMGQFNEPLGMRQGVQGQFNPMLNERNIGMGMQDVGMQGMGMQDVGMQGLGSQRLSARPFDQGFQRNLGDQMDFQEPRFRRSMGNVGQRML